MNYFGYSIMILEIIAIIIIFIVICLFLFLLIGLKVNINLNKQNSDFKGQIEIKCGFIKIFSKNFPDKDNKDKLDKKEDKENKKNKSKKTSEYNENMDKIGKNQLNVFKSLILLIKKNFDDILDLFSACINSVKLEKFNTNILLGLSSPVDTVNVVGSIWAFSAVSNLSKNFYLSAEPIFTKETIDFNTEIAFKISFLRPLGKLLRLLTKKSMIKFILESRKVFNND